MKLTLRDVLLWTTGCFGFHWTDRNFCDSYNLNFRQLRQLLVRLEAAGLAQRISAPQEGLPRDEQPCTWIARVTYGQALALIEARGFDLNEGIETEPFCQFCRAKHEVRLETGKRKVGVWTEARLQPLRVLGRQAVALLYTCPDCRKELAGPAAEAAAA